MEYSTENVLDSVTLHKRINEIGDWLEKCKIVVVNRIRGIHYIAFEERQISMLEIKGLPETFLEDIRECVQHCRTGKKIPMEHNAIFELRPGIFHTDLREVMKGNTSYNSKQILVPFLKKQKYSLLEIICEHVPKWLENEQNELNIRISVENYNEEIGFITSTCRGYHLGFLAVSGISRLVETHKGNIIFLQPKNFI